MHNYDIFENNLTYTQVSRRYSNFCERICLGDEANYNRSIEYIIDFLEEELE